MAPQSNPPHALAPETSYRPRVPGGIEDRLDEVLGHEGNPYESNYVTMIDGIRSAKVLSRRCRDCRGTGMRRFTEKDKKDRERRLKRFDDDIAATESEHHRAKLLSAKRFVMTEEFPTEDQCRTCNGVGSLYAPSAKPLAEMWSTRRCQPCRGSGEVFDPKHPHRSEDREDVCPHCSQRHPWELHGYHVVCTARPKPAAAGGSGWSGASSTDNPLDALPAIVARQSVIQPETAYEYGRIQRAIREVRTDNAVLATAIETYHGPQADRWKLHPWGRRFCLWPLTLAGAQLARESELRATARFLPVDVIASERQAEEGSAIANVRRRALIRDADQQARALEALLRDRVARIEL